jgi:hypothetical protein
VQLRQEFHCRSVCAVKGYQAISVLWNLCGQSHIYPLHSRLRLAPNLQNKCMVACNMSLRVLTSLKLVFDRVSSSIRGSSAESASNFAFASSNAVSTMLTVGLSANQHFLLQFLSHKTHLRDASSTLAYQ